MPDSDSAGVAGLTTAFLLSKNPRYEITIAAKHMPGDYDIEYASPWAGANYMPSVHNFFGAKFSGSNLTFIESQLGERQPKTGRGTPGALWRTLPATILRPAFISREQKYITVKGTSPLLLECGLLICSVPTLGSRLSLTT